MLGRTRKKVVTAKWGTLARGMVQHGRWKYSGKTGLYKDATEDNKQVQQENLVIEGDSKNVIKIQQLAFHLFPEIRVIIFLAHLQKSKQSGNALAKHRELKRSYQLHVKVLFWALGCKSFSKF